MKKLNLILLILLLGIISCKKETDLESDIQPKDIETESLLSEISGPSIEEINLREYSSSQAADFFSLDFISSSSASAQTRSKVNLFLLKANETLYKYTSGDQAKLLIESIGYPAWDIGRVLGLYKEYGREIVYVPTFESDRKTVKALIYFEFSKEETVVVRTYDAKLYTLIYKQYPDETKAEYINSFFDFFNNQQNLSANTRDCGDACSWQETSWGRQCLQTSSGSMTTSGTPCPNECCLTGGGLDQGNEDLALWFTFGTFINPHIEIGGNNNSGGNNNTDPIHELINSSDEQAMIAFLMERFGWDATHPNVLSIVTYPNYMVAIIQHVAINGSSVESVQRFIDFMNNHGNLAGLSTEELITLINMLPQVRGKINLGILDNYLNSHDTDAVSVFVLHDIIRLVDGNPELTSAAPSILDDFYRALSPAVSDWIQNPLKVTFRRTVVNSYLINGGPFGEVEARRNRATDLFNTKIEYDLEFNSTTINFLLSLDNQVLYEVNDFLINRTDLMIQARQEATEIYTHLMASDADFSSYIAEDHPAIPGWMWPLLREIGIEVAYKLAIKYGPAGTANEVAEAVRNLGQGEILDFLGNILHIVKTKIPALATVSLTLDGIELGGKAAKAWKAIAKMEQFGDEVIGKFLTTIKNHTTGFLGKLKWKGGNTGMELLDVANPNNFWNEFKGLFPDITGPYPNPTQPLEQTYRVLNGNIEIKFYPNSNTTGGFTLSFRVRPGGTPIKVRFL